MFQLFQHSMTSLTESTFIKADFDPRHHVSIPQEQLEEMAEMLSPPEREALARVTARLTGLQTAHAQTTEDLFMYNLRLESQRK